MWVEDEADILKPETRRLRQKYKRIFITLLTASFVEVIGSRRRN
jgi:hypothetical protein